MAFLPEMESANRTLEEAMREQPAENFDIERVAEGSHHIEMVCLDFSSCRRLHVCLQNLGNGSNAVVS